MILNVKLKNLFLLLYATSLSGLIKTAPYKGWNGYLCLVTDDTEHVEDTVLNTSFHQLLGNSLPTYNTIQSQ